MSLFHKCKKAEDEVVPDQEMEKACLEAYDEGERTTLQDRITELTEACE